MGKMSAKCDCGSSYDLVYQCGQCGSTNCAGCIEVQQHNDSISFFCKNCGAAIEG